jgi:hypothetical protein
MAVRKIIFSDQDWCKGLTGSNFSTGSWETLAPISYIINNIRPQRVAQSVDNTDASNQFILDLGAGRSVGIIYFANLITEVACTMQVKLATDSGITSLVYDSGSVSAWASDADGTLSEDEIIGLGRTRVFVPSAPVTGRYLQVLFSQTSATTALRLGSLSVCSVYEPTYPGDIGGNFTVVDDSNVDRAPYGSFHVMDRGKRNRFNFGLPAVERDEGFKELLRLARIRGKSKPIIVCQFPDDFTPAIGLERFSIYGVMVNDNVLNNPQFGIYAQSFSIEQL